MSDAEIKTLWPKLDPALKLILLTGQRPGEVAAMAEDTSSRASGRCPESHRATGPGPRTARSPGRAIRRGAGSDGPPRRRASAQKSALLLKSLVAELELERATPHDLRRTALTRITKLGFGRDAMDRIANHRKGGITDVYDRHSYEEEDRRIMAAVARHFLSIVEGTGISNVVSLR